MGAGGGALTQHYCSLQGEDYTVRAFSPPSVNISFSQPGVHFVGIYCAWDGWMDGGDDGTCEHLGDWPRDLKTGKAFQPYAIVTPFQNGTVPALPLNFDGPRLITKPIPGDWRLALRVSKMTVFNGGIVFIRAVHGPAFPVRFHGFSVSLSSLIRA